MLWIDHNGKIVIGTEIEAKNLYEIHFMKQTILELLATQHIDYHDQDKNYWAFELVKILEPQPDQVCLEQFCLEKK
jgi:hypothetical protein